MTAIDLRTRLIFILVLIGILPLILIGIININYMSSLLKSEQIAQERSLLRSKAQNIERFIRATVDDVQIISESRPIRELAHAIILRDNLDIISLRRDVVDLFSIYMLNRRYNDTPLYARMRFLDNNGFEFIRVDLEDGNLREVALYNYRTREDYFIQTSQLTAGEIYVSSVFLFHEFGNLQEPFNPVMSYGTPLYENDELIGVLILDVQAQGFLDEVQNAVPSGSTSFLADHNGYFLSHSDDRLEFGAERRTYHTLSRDYSELEDVFTANDGFAELEKNLVFYQTIFPPGQQDFQWTLVSIRSKDVALAGVRQQEGLLWFALTLVGVMITIIAWYFARIISDPILILADKAVQMSRGDLHQRVKFDREDEIGILADSFNSMNLQLNTLINNLEERVEARTRDLRVAADVSRQITTVLGIQDLIKQIVILTAQQFDLDAVFIFLLDDDDTTLNCMVGASRTGLVDALVPPVNVDDTPLSISQAARNRETVVIHQLREAQIPAIYGADAAAELAIPMMLGDKLLGVFYLYSLTPNRFQKDDLRVLQALAEQVTVAVRNAQLFAKAQKAQKVAEEANNSKSLFLANISHELRTPLNAILGFSQILQRHPTATSEQRQSLDIIIRNGEHLLQLIDDVLEMSKLDTGRVALHTGNFDLIDSLQSLEAMFRIRAEAKNLVLEFVYDDDVPRYIATDETKLRQVLTNLVGNAIKYTASGYVRLYVTHPETDCIHFAVEDTGCGIERDEIPYLFETFVRGRQHFNTQIGGTGLGLPISQQFVRLMGGDLIVDSMVGQGSTFGFAINVEVIPPELIRPTVPMRQILGLKTPTSVCRILIVEDNWDTRALLVRMLESIGLDVLEAVNGQEALELVSIWQPHLILMDMYLPVLDGYEATRQIRAMTTEIPIVALTASVYEHDRERMLAAGCNEVIHKPFREADIFQRIEQYTHIEFIYSQESDIPDVDIAFHKLLTREMIAALPTEWLQRFHYQVMTARSELCLQLLEDIKETHPMSYSAMRTLIENFRFDLIIQQTGILVT